MTFSLLSGDFNLSGAFSLLSWNFNCSVAILTYSVQLYSLLHSAFRVLIKALRLVQWGLTPTQ